MPGDLTIEARIRAAIRWNALMIVLRASKKDLELGGHIGSFASSAMLYDVGFNHFPACAAECAFKFLDNFAITAYRAV